MRNVLVLLLCAAIAAPGCATARYSRTVFQAPRGADGQVVDPALMASYVRQVPVGSRIKVTLVAGRTLRGTLMKNDADPIVVQERTRVPEPPIEIAIKDIAALELEGANGGSPGRTVAIAVAAGAAATLGVLLILAAIFADD
jgi:hypothetical protein